MTYMDSWRPVTVNYLGLEPSDALTARILHNVDRLQRQVPDLRACHVRVQLDHRHQHQGRPFAVMLDATLTDFELAVTRAQHEDVYVALRDAFDALQHQIERVTERRQAGVRSRGEHTIRRPRPGAY